jgi:hypothetical protein
MSSAWTIAQRDLEEMLNELVGQRFEDIPALKACMAEFIPYTIHNIEEATRHEDDQIEGIDFELITVITSEDGDANEIYCDTSIYYIWDNAHNYYITEIGCDFE